MTGLTLYTRSEDTGMGGGATMQLVEMTSLGFESIVVDCGEYGVAGTNRRDKRVFISVCGWRRCVNKMHGRVVHHRLVCYL